MYLVNHRTEQTADRAKIYADWKSRFHQPAGVEINVSTNSERITAGHSVLLDGDTKDVHGVLFGCAEIAWGLGWRPRGLMPLLMAFVQGFKIPPMTRPGK